MVPGVVATAAIGVGLAQGALAASFAVSGQSFKVEAEQLDGYGFSQYGSIAEGTDLKGNKAAHPVAVSSFKSAKITNMCQSVVTPNVPFLGSVSLELTAGTKGAKDEDRRVSASNLYIDVANLDADATFKNIDIGIAQGSTSKGPDAKGPATQPNNKNINPNGFAQQADEAHLSNVKQTAWATTAGTFTLPDLHMELHRGVKECF
jgi:hypothetical protein